MLENGNLWVSSREVLLSLRAAILGGERRVDRLLGCGEKIFHRLGIENRFGDGEQQGRVSYQTGGYACLAA